MKPAVIFDNVSKKFRRGERHDSLRDLVPSLVRRAFRPQPTDVLDDQEFWALRNVSFEVCPGEALGIIGPNGAGKSTALKVLTRILKPTSGHSRVVGRTGALIEVAAGFHPELTGRENVFLQGAIMGMRRAEIARKLDAIVSFAGIDAFIDTPVKRYSSGMNARLGFSIAAHLDPAVLIIDEVLSVGDMAFQQRCLDRMLEFKANGVAMVFVSHNLPAVANLCNRAISLSSGQVGFAGPTDQATQHYLQSHFTEDVSASDRSRFSNVTLTDSKGAVSTCRPGARLRLSAQACFEEDVRDVTFGFVVHQGASGIYVYGVNSGSLGVPPRSFRRGERVDISFEFFANLTRGLYLIELHAATASTMTIHARRLPAAVLRVEESLTAQGVADLAAQCTTREVREPQLV